MLAIALGSSTERTSQVVSVWGSIAVEVLIVGVNFAPERTGIAPYTTRLAKGLAAAGHSVRVLTSVPHYPEWHVPPEYSNARTRDEEQDGVLLTRVRPRVPRVPTALRRARFEISFGLRAALSRWGHPDAVILVSPALLGSAMALGRTKLRRRRPAVGLWVQDLYSAGVRETGLGTGAVARGFSVLEGRLARSAHGVAVIHERFAESLRRLGVSAEKLPVLPNWTHMVLRRAKPRSPTTAKRWAGLLTRQSSYMRARWV